MRLRYFAPLAAAVATVSAFALPATAQAATAGPAAAACSGWSVPYGVAPAIDTYDGLEYWISENCSGQVRAAMIIRGGGSDFHLWIYNGSKTAATSSNKHDQSIYTGVVSLNKISTRACVQPINPNGGAPLGDKRCYGPGVA